MKNLFLTFFGIVFLNLCLPAQAPEGFNYQAVARDEAGQPIANQSVGIQIGILENSAEGELVYQETFFPETNEFGLVNLLVGQGQAVFGDFSEIQWGDAAYFVEVGMDPDGGSNFSPMGVSQLMSVPYALHSLSAANVFSGDYNDLENAPDLGQYVSIEGAQDGDLLYFQGENWNRLPIGEENQVMIVKNNIPQWASVSFGDTDLFPPAVEITSVSGITSEKATINADVTDDGGANVTDRGIVWGLNENPGFDDNVTQEGSGTGTFSITLEDLEEETTYFVRAYATNGIGTSFSSQQSFTTLSESDTTGTVTDIDGNVYNTVMINDLWWMAENLKTTKYDNGDDIATGYSEDDWVDLTKGAWAYFNDNSDWDPIYGKLYNWYAVDDPRGLCPTGWRMPTDDEIKDLRDLYGGFQEAGGALKETGTAEDGDGYWREPNEGATNITGFTARPGGARIYGVFFNRETTGYFWTGDQFDDDAARNYLMVYDTSSLLRHIYQKHYGLSVRCVKE